MVGRACSFRDAASIADDRDTFRKLKICCARRDRGDIVLVTDSLYVALTYKTNN